VEDAERHIREAVDQTKLIDKADELRLEMERRIEDLRGDMDRLDQRRAEAFQLENDFVKIRRLADDVNAKMTRFLTEQRRIETMEAAFNRLLLTSKSVDEKLVQVTASDDTLQGMQLQIRKLEEALGATEEKYQRIERKGQVLDNTNDGIDRNFKLLQDAEKQSAKINGDIGRYAEDLDSMKASIEKLSGESERASEAAEKIDVLEGLLDEVEERIKSLQRARQWIADAETRLEELNRQAQTQARAIDSMVKGKKSNAPVDTGNSTQLSSQQLKENVISLARQGWKTDEIAKSMKISRGQVELILDLAPRD
jgi:DNA repair exonuclease SbcCD ATPase subunit